MFDSRPLNAVRSELDKLRNDQVSFLANGGAKDFAEYRHVCGIIRGLTHADEYIKDLVQRINTDD
jgi:hypothetical protein